MAAKNINPDSEDEATAAARLIEMSPNGYAKQCGVCHAGGGQMEYDRDMNAYGATSPSGDRYTYLLPALVTANSVTAGRIVDISADATIQSTSLYGDNKMEVDCLLCHMQEVRPGAAWYKNTLLCSDTNQVGPSDNPNCGSQKVVFMDMVSGGSMTVPDNRFTFAVGDFFDTYNRNIAISLGYFKQATSAAIGAGINLATGAISGMPTTIAGSKIGAPKSANCAACHARTQSDGIGLPGEAQVFGGMIAGFGNYVRLYEPGTTFDWDKIAADGTCTSNCANDKQWMEFGCKTGMGKRSQKSGYGNQDRWGNGFCLVCDSQSQWANPASFCALPSVQADCIAKSGISALVSDGNPMSLIDMTAEGPMPKLIPGKLPDVDVHDASPKGMTCSSCHYTVAGTTTAKTISGNGASYTYPATTYEKMDHQIARGYSMLEQAGNETDGMVSCAGCHIAGENHHPNAAALAAPIAGHAGFPALHFEKIDCRTCHIPEVYSYPGRLLFRDWTAGAYRQGEGSNGNANHFDFAMDMLDGSYASHKPMKLWLKTPEGTKIVPGLPSLLPTWTASAIKVDGSVAGWSPAKTRDITPAAARVAAARPDLGIRLNGTNDHPPFNGFHLTDPFKIESKEKIDLMAAELLTTGAGIATHGKVRDARINLFPIFFDPSHGITPKEFALGAPSKGGCVMCHSSSNPSSPSYSPNSVGFFDSEKELMMNGMMQMANADCDNPYMFSAMTGTTTVTCEEYHPMFPTTCNGYAPGTTSTGVANGTMGMCKQQIGGMLAGQMGMTPDSNMRMDGVEFMQMMAIREGGTPAGCNPMMGIFLGMSHPMVTNCTNAAAQAANGGSPLGYMYSREEIKLHFAKMLQQSTFTPAVAGMTYSAGGTVPSTMNRVFGTVSVAQNPAQGTGKTTFDIGATCYNPMDFTHTQIFPCGDPAEGMNMVKTFIKANEMLGYTSTQLAKLMSMSTSAPSVAAPMARFSYQISGTTVTFDASSSVNATSYTWNFGAGTSSVSSTSSANPVVTWTDAGTKTVTLAVSDGSTPSPVLTKLIVLTAAATSAPVASGSVTVSDGLATLTNTSTDALRSVVNWGDGSVQTLTTTEVTHLYKPGVYTGYLSVTDGKGGHAVMPFSVNVSTSLGTITGLISDGTNSIGGAVVTLISNGTGSATIASVFSNNSPTTSPTYGHYTLSNVPFGSYSVKVQKNGYTTTTTALASAVSGTTSVIHDVTLTEVGANTLFTVSGVISGPTPTGTLVQLMKVVSVSPTVTVVAQQTLTPDVTGAFAFVNIPAGTYQVNPEPRAPATVTNDGFEFVVTGNTVISAATFTYNP